MKMKSISVLLTITKVADFQWKYTDVNWTQGMYRVIYIFCGCPPLPSFNVSKVCISASNLTLANIVPMSSICFAKIPSQEYLT